jgi:hypothetical protein
MTSTFQPVLVRTGSEDAEGRLLFIGDELVAVLVRLDDEIHGEDRGKWFVEVRFGHVKTPEPPLFSDPQEAANWLADAPERQLSRAQ